MSQLAYRVGKFYVTALHIATHVVDDSGLQSLGIEWHIRQTRPKENRKDFVHTLVGFELQRNISELCPFVPNFRVGKFAF